MATVIIDKRSTLRMVGTAERGMMSMRQKERRAAALSRFVGGLGREGGGPEKMNGVFNHGLAGWARIFCGAAESVLSAIRG
jgi:hypothetical protein